MEETCYTIFFSNIIVTSPLVPDLTQLKSWSELVLATYQSQQGETAPPMTASSRLETEVALLERSSPEVIALQSGKTSQP